MFKPFHLIGLELGISVASVGLRGEATGAPVCWRGELVAIATRDLVAGEMLDGEGGFTVYGKLLPAKESLRLGGLSLGLAHGLKLKKAVEAGQTVAWKDVDYDPASLEVRFRREMELRFRRKRLLHCRVPELPALVLERAALAVRAPVAIERHSLFSAGETSDQRLTGRAAVLVLLAVVDEISLVESPVCLKMTLPGDSDLQIDALIPPNGNNTTTL